jgi:hypothetical protein
MATAARDLTGARVPTSGRDQIAGLEQTGGRELTAETGLARPGATALRPPPKTPPPG